jgi:hypothetical protein
MRLLGRRLARGAFTRTGLLALLSEPGPHSCGPRLLITLAFAVGFQQFEPFIIADYAARGPYRPCTDSFGARLGN